jgi:hypothetical protein
MVMKEFRLLFFILLAFGFVAIATDTRAETNTVSSTVVTNSTPPTANAPSIINSNSDICKVGVGGSVQNNVLGLATGILVDDELCQSLKLSRSLYSMGMKVAAVSVLCQDPRVFDAMTDAGTPCPYNGMIGAEAQQAWLDNADEIPNGSKYKADYIEARVEEQPEGDNDALKNFGLMALSLLLLF